MMRGLLVGLLVVLILVAPARAEPATPTALTVVGELAGRYEQTTGYAPNADWFGAYSLAGVGDELYVGLGTARPGEEDGALLARWDDGMWTPVYAPSEQGFIEMEAADGRLYFPGPDPMEDWSSGEIYIHDLVSGETIKRRTLANVLHAWGLWREPTSGQIFVAVGRHTGDNATWQAGLYVSDDEGASWSVDDDPALGGYRTYDVIGTRRGLAAIAADGYSDDGCQLAVARPGRGWQRGPGWIVCRARLGSDLRGAYPLALLPGGRGIYTPMRNREVLFPGFVVDTWAYNWLAKSADEYFVVTADGRVMGSGDLLHWREVASFGRGLVSIAYWPARGSLVVAERGAAGRLWLVPV